MGTIEIVVTLDSRVYLERLLEWWFVERWRRRESPKVVSLLVSFSITVKSQKAYLYQRKVDKPKGNGPLSALRPLTLVHYSLFKFFQLTGFFKQWITDLSRATNFPVSHDDDFPTAVNTTVL